MLLFKIEIKINSNFKSDSVSNYNMGVLEFFGTLLRSNITSVAIQENYRTKTAINHLLIDFNSIIHNVVVDVLHEINSIMRHVLQRVYEKKSILTDSFLEFEAKYRLESVRQALLKADSELVVEIFHKYFDEACLDRIITTRVINTIIFILKTYAENDAIQTLFIAIDGVPSKAKMLEQRQRRYMGVAMETYRKQLLDENASYLKAQPNNAWLAEKYAITWMRSVKITPGTRFMHKLGLYLHSDAIQDKIRAARPNLHIVISDCYEVGEGEKKIVNYVENHLANTQDTVVVYSPDGDVILLCMLMPLSDIQLLKFNQQTMEYNMINIQLLKSNIAFYINEDVRVKSKTEFDAKKISYDIVCLATLFGDDFVPKIETVNVKRGFQSIIDHYLDTLLELQAEKCHLVKKINGRYTLSLTFLRLMLEKVATKIEADFVINNKLYAEYVNLGQIKNVFSYLEIDASNIMEIYRNFRKRYSDLKMTISQRRSLHHFEVDKLFIYSLKRCIILPFNVQHLKPTDLLQVLIDYYAKYGDLPKLNLNLNTASHSIRDTRFRNKIQEMNAFQRQEFQAMNMLDEYYEKFNAQTLDLTPSGVTKYYQTYFNIELGWNAKHLSDEAVEVMQHYIEGLLWVFEYYYNDFSYLNVWYYRFERSPLLRHVVMYLKMINRETFRAISQNLPTYQIKASDFFNPVEQLIYVSPMSPQLLESLPTVYADFLRNKSYRANLDMIFTDVADITQDMARSKTRYIDCHSIPFLNKCLISVLHKPSTEADKLYLETIRAAITPDASAKRRTARIDRRSWPKN